MDQTKKSELKIYSEVLYAPGAGGEFFSLLLESHKSDHWTRIPLCCFDWHYYNYNYFHSDVRTRQIRPIHRISYSRLSPVVFLKAPMDYIIDIRKKKSSRLNHLHDKQWLEDNTEDDIASEDFADVTISHLDPLKNYYKMCDMMEMEPDIEFYSWAWWNYLGIQHILLNKEYNYIEKVRNNLKECFGDFNGVN